MGAYVPSVPLREASRDFLCIRVPAGDQDGSGGVLPRDRFVDLSTGKSPTLVSGNTSGAVTSFVGVVKETPNAVGSPMSVIVEGLCHLDALAAISDGDLVMAGADGKARPALNGEIAHGFAIGDGSTAAGVRVYLFPPMLGKAKMKVTKGTSAGTGEEQTISHGLGTGAAPSLVVVEALPYIKAVTYSGAAVTGNAAPQNTAHGFGAKPDAIIPDGRATGMAFSAVSADATNAIITATTGKEYGFTAVGIAYGTPNAVQGTHTATDLKLTVDLNVKYGWTAYGRAE